MGSTNSKTEQRTLPEEDHFYKMSSGRIIGLDIRPESCAPFISGQQMTYPCSCSKKCPDIRATFLGKSKKGRDTLQYVFLDQTDLRCFRINEEKVAKQKDTVIKILVDEPLVKIDWLDPSSQEVFDMLENEPVLDHYLANKNGLMHSFDVRDKQCAPYVSGQIVVNHFGNRCIFLGKGDDGLPHAFDEKNQMFQTFFFESQGPVVISPINWLTPDEVAAQKEKDEKEEEKEEKSKVENIDSDSDSDSESSSSDSEDSDPAPPEKTESKQKQKPKAKVPAVAVQNKDGASGKKGIVVTVEFDDETDFEDFEVVIRNPNK